MADSKVYVKPLGPFAVIERLIKTVQETSPGARVSQFYVNTPHGTITLTANEIAVADLPSNETFKSQWESLKSADFILVHGISIHLNDHRSLHYNNQEADGPHITIRFHRQQENENLASYLKIVAALQNHFTLLHRFELGSLRLPADELHAFKFAEQTIGGFATEAAKLAQSTAKNFEEFSRLLRERMTELDARYAAKEAELDTRYQEKLKDLEGRESSHAESVKQFELRNNTAVRRDLLKEIRTKIENQAVLQLSKPTSRKRWVLHIFCGLSLVLSAVLAGVFAHKLLTAATFNWHYLLPLSTGALIFVSTGIFYIRWNDQWFRDHARAEIETRKLSADILRASWLAELFFEWEQKKETSMPPELVTSFTRGLFDATALDGKLHPADQVQEFLKELATLKIDKGGVEITKRK